MAPEKPASFILYIWEWKKEQERKRERKTEREKNKMQGKTHWVICEAAVSTCLFPSTSPAAVWEAEAALSNKSQCTELQQWPSVSGILWWQPHASIHAILVRNNLVVQHCMEQLCAWQQHHHFISFFLCVRLLNVYSFPATYLPVLCSTRWRVLLLFNSQCCCWQKLKDTNHAHSWVANSVLIQS